tara:strand:- start:1119 stop:1271 length:153 start_codon:yes stop_codon:yes gene_type:complete
MSTKALDDFIDDCFVNGDEICRFRKYEDRINIMAARLIEGIKQERIQVHK